MYRRSPRSSPKLPETSRSAPRKFPRPPATFHKPSRTTPPQNQVLYYHLLMAASRTLLGRLGHFATVPAARAPRSSPKLPEAPRSSPELFAEHNTPVPKACHGVPDNHIPKQFAHKRRKQNETALLNSPKPGPELRKLMSLYFSGSSNEMLYSAVHWTTETTSNKQEHELCGTDTPGILHNMTTIL